MPPMFATAVGPGERCNYCQHRSKGNLTTIKLVLPSGVQVCPVCRRGGRAGW
jgi:hypothetical protein